MKKILLIEDDKTLLKTTRQVLEREQFNVLTANCGKEGLAKATNTIPDLIVSNIIMPGINGYQLYDNLRLYEQTRNIPFIFLSVKPLKQPAGFKSKIDYLSKPVKTSDLIRAVRQKLRQKSGPAINSLEELRAYFLAAEKLEYKRGTEVFKEGRKANFIYLLASGLVKTHRMDTYGKELITGLYKPDDIFGSYYFKKPSYYPETATTLEKSVLYRISSWEFQEILAGSQKLTVELAQMLSENILQLKNNLLEMAYSSVLKKTTNTILEFARLFPDYAQTGIKISRTDLASLAGISTESFIRSLSSLKKDGLIDIEGRHIKILNLKELNNIR